MNDLDLVKEGAERMGCDLETAAHVMGTSAMTMNVMPKEMAATILFQKSASLKEAQDTLAMVAAVAESLGITK